jgi:hypothetical protein
VRIGESQSVSIDFGNIQDIKRWRRVGMIGVKSTPQSTFSRVDTATQRGSGVVSAPGASFVGRDITNLSVHVRVFGCDLARLF